MKYRTIDGTSATIGRGCCDFFKFFGTYRPGLELSDISSTVAQKAAELGVEDLRYYITQALGRGNYVLSMPEGPEMLSESEIERILGPCDGEWYVTGVSKRTILMDTVKVGIIFNVFEMAYKEKWPLTYLGKCVNISVIGVTEPFLIHREFVV